MLLLLLEEMTTTKTKRRKSDQLSPPGPEELSVYSSTKNIWMEEKASSFPRGEKHRQIHLEALMHFFDPDKNGENFKYQVPIKADPTSKARRKTTAESIPIEAEENKCSSDIGKMTQGKGAFIVLLQFNLLYFSPTRH